MPNLFTIPRATRKAPPAVIKPATRYRRDGTTFTVLAKAPGKARVHPYRGLTRREITYPQAVPGSLAASRIASIARRRMAGLGISRG